MTKPLPPFASKPLAECSFYALQYILGADGRYRIEVLPVRRNTDWQLLGFFPPERLAPVFGDSLANQILSGSGDKSTRSQFTVIEPSACFEVNL
jgi:hypothetical protein